MTTEARKLAEQIEASVKKTITIKGRKYWRSAREIQREIERRKRKALSRLSQEAQDNG